MMSRAAWQSPRTSFSVKATFLSRFVLFRTSSSLPISASASHMAADQCRGQARRLLLFAASLLPKCNFRPEQPKMPNC